MGADVSMCSLTKYVNGHADVTMGAISTDDKDLHTQLKMLQISKTRYLPAITGSRSFYGTRYSMVCISAIGVTPSPFDCYLVMRGLKTLSCRMRQHEQSAFRVAQYLDQHEMVEKVLYPGTYIRIQLEFHSSLRGRTEVL